MIPPFPSSEYAESPTKFDALTLAQTLEPHAKLYGALLRTVIGILHWAELRIFDDVPGQSATS